MLPPPLALASQSYGEGPAQIVIAHGLFGSGRNWTSIAKALAEKVGVMTVDLRNHGSSPWSEDTSYEAMASDLAKVIEGLGGQADVVGHSMGGKAAITLVRHRPELVRRLVIVDIAPIAYAHDNAAIIAALKSLPLADITSRGDADVRLEQSLPDKGLRAFLLQNLERQRGGFGWRMNLTALAAGMAGIEGFPEGFFQAHQPTLAVCGARSAYVDATGEAALRRTFVDLELQWIADAGHWPHAEHPSQVVDALSEFLLQRSTPLS